MTASIREEIWTRKNSFFFKWLVAKCESVRPCTLVYVTGEYILRLFD